MRWPDPDELAQVKQFVALADKLRPEAAALALAGAAIMVDRLRNVATGLEAALAANDPATPEGGEKKS